MVVLARCKQQNANSQVPVRCPEYPDSKQQLKFSAFERAGTALMVVGHTCAGKTTFGEYARHSHNLLFIEASSILRIVEDNSGISDPAPFVAARNALESLGPDVVARKILELYGNQLDAGFVVTGFRTIEEVEVIRNHFPHVRVVLVEASERTRFQRLIERVRTPQIRKRPIPTVFTECE